MASSLLRVLGATALFTSCVLAQLTGSLTYDGVETLQAVIENPTQSNFTIPGSNNLFDRQNVMAYNPISITNLTGGKITLNGTENQPPPLSDDVFQTIPPGGSYIRNLNVSEYLLRESAQGLALNTVSQCFIATLPPSVYALNVTGITGAQTVATYYLDKGLQAVSITSVPLHFNFSVPADFYSFSGSGNKQRRQRKATRRGAGGKRNYQHEAVVAKT